MASVVRCSTERLISAHCARSFRAWNRSAAAPGASAPAHPHYNKSTTADLPGGVQAVITYNTTPANETRATSAPLGVFTTPRGPKLKLSADLKSGEKVIAAAGEYVIGVNKNSENTKKATDIQMTLVASASALRNAGS